MSPGTVSLQRASSEDHVNVLWFVGVKWSEAEGLKKASWNLCGHRTMSGRRRLQSSTSLCQKSLVTTLGAAPHSPGISGVQKQASLLQQELLQQELRSRGRCGVGASICTHLSATRPAPLKSHFHLSGRHRQSAPRPAPVGQQRASAGRTFCCISIRGCPIPHSGWACDPGLAGQLTAPDHSESPIRVHIGPPCVGLRRWVPRASEDELA